MSASNQPDPRLSLPDWLRDGDTPLPSAVATKPVAQPVVATEVVEVVEVVQVVTEPVQPATPFSDRLSLDTRLDPERLISPEDLPLWLGGLERLVVAPGPSSPLPVKQAPVAHAIAIEAPEPYEGVDAPDEGVVDVQVNGWYLIVAALGLLILLAAALRLYLA